MAGARIEVAGAEAVRRRLVALAQGITDKRPLLDSLGGLVESQTRRRLSQDKEGPNGEPWPDWSDSYKATRRTGHHLLESTGTLIDSVHYMVRGDAVEVGSGMVYAAIHHFGGAEAGKPEIPARPWLGVSEEDGREIDEVLGDWLGRIA
ncbi:phage virion morphogenesis protein [Azospirillum halopraeferens]|uniref:phage virion morphogenesis protein n=1 Tax=Azospirillum halopraeferens TaxID=34010 RepID=UPI0004193AF9|nr:phage virion morphogenesis protein [Azospirillum halopraeferens]